MRNKSFDIADEAIFREQVHFLSALYQKGIYIDHRHGSRTTFIYFCSLFDPLGSAVARLALSPLNANCIYLYDDRNLSFVLGVRQCGPSLEHTDAALRQYIRHWGASRVFSVGCSAAGF